MYRTRSERGQMVVIVGLALTILVSMVGVVIDGGMALSNRRQVQNAADAASLAGTRVLGLDVRWRATGSPNPPGAPFGANADDAVCDAINAALGYDENNSQQIDTIDCYTGSPDAEYVGLDASNNIIPVGIVGQGIPLNAQGVRVHATGHSDTLLMKVVGIDTLDIAGEASALAGPGGAAQSASSCRSSCRIRCSHSLPERHTRSDLRARANAEPPPWMTRCTLRWRAPTPSCWRWPGSRS